MKTNTFWVLKVFKKFKNQKTIFENPKKRYLNVPFCEGSSNNFYNYPPPNEKIRVFVHPDSGFIKLKSHLHLDLYSCIWFVISSLSIMFREETTQKYTFHPHMWLHLSSPCNLFRCDLRCEAFLLAAQPFSSCDTVRQNILTSTYLSSLWLYIILPSKHNSCKMATLTSCP